MAATALEFLSVQLFGRPMRLPVALQILDNASGIFYATEIADALGLRPNNVTEELSRLQSLGMILPLPRRLTSIGEREGACGCGNIDRRV